MKDGIPILMKTKSRNYEIKEKRKCPKTLYNLNYLMTNFMGANSS
jgi:hypothetical protein